MSEKLEARLRGLLAGEHSSLALEFNEHHSNYMDAAEAIVSGYYDSVQWASESEKQAAADLDSVWTLQWYPETPVGFCRMGASSLPALFAALPRPGHHGEVG